MGVARDTFYRVKEAKESGGLDALLHKDRRRSNLKNRVDDAVEQAVLAFAHRQSRCRAGSSINELNPLSSCSGVILTGDTHEHIHGRRDQTLDSAP
jgi:Winged helix-turn helix